MKKVNFVFALIAVGLSAGCLEKPSSTPGTASTILYRHHFLGTANLAHNTNAAKIPVILGMPATRAFTDEILQKLAKSPEVLWRKFLPAGASTPPGLVRPLLDDLAAAESYAEVHGPLNKSETVLAIELSDERASLWRTNVSKIFTNWKLGSPSPLSLGTANGWEIKKTDAPTLIQFVRAGKWVLVGLGQEKLTLLPGLLEQITKNGRPIASQPTVPLELEADFPRLGDWLPDFTRYKLPHASMTVTGKGDYLRTEVHLPFSESLPWTEEPWKIPTNLVRDPIISFTAARGIAPLLSQVKDISSLGVKPLPNQFCAWGLATVLGETLFSIPVANASNLLYQIGPNLQDFTTELLSQRLGGFVLASNINEMAWQGWPVIIPHVRAIRERDSDYLVGGLLPFPPATNPTPAGLFSQLKDPKLIYYDWELTEVRLTHAKQLQQVWDITRHRMLASTNAPEQQWLLAVARHLGNTITEATLTSPKELTIVRKSDFGATGFELVTLARWVASAGFPWTFEPPPALFSGTAPPGPSFPAIPSGPKSNPTAPKAPGPAPKSR